MNQEDKSVGTLDEKQTDVGASAEPRKPDAPEEFEARKDIEDKEQKGELNEVGPGAQMKSQSAERDMVENLRAELEGARAKAEENRSLYLKTLAENENIRKRAERDLQNAHKYALDKFVNELLPVKDSLEMGVAAANDIVDVNKLREGSELTLRMLTSVMEKFGVQEINPVGEKFNPELHEAMTMQPSDRAEPNTVLQVIQRGYRLNDRLIRPAMVIVAQKAPRQN